MYHVDNFMFQLFAVRLRALKLNVRPSPPAPVTALSTAAHRHCGLSEWLAHRSRAARESLGVIT